ncbi:hypothetical protein BE20_19875 [Sorangium cellulosum]|nr:hypothetical protein BE20_19875 [Sorangium cellulosum]
MRHSHPFSLGTVSRRTPFRYSENSALPQSAWLMTNVIAVVAPNAVPGSAASTRRERQARAALVRMYRMIHLIFLLCTVYNAPC